MKINGTSFVALFLGLVATGACGGSTKHSAGDEIPSGGPTASGGQAGTPLAGMGTGGSRPTSGGATSEVGNERGGRGTGAHHAPGGEGGADSAEGGDESVDRTTQGGVTHWFPNGGGAQGGKAESDLDSMGGVEDVPFVSGIPGDRTLDSLSEAERNELCAEMVDYGHSPSITLPFSDLTCRYLGVNAAQDLETDDVSQLIAACNQRYLDCRRSGMTDVRATCPNNYSDCAATIDEFAACQSALPEEYRHSILRCDELTEDNLFQATAFAPRPAACTPLDEKCPLLFNSAPMQ